MIDKMNKCRFIPQKEFPSLLAPAKKTKAGRYHQSMFWDLNGWGESTWIVAVRIDINEFGDTKNKTGIKELVEECIAELNKGSRKNSKPPYGNLQFYSAEIKENEEHGRFISALLSIDSKNNKNFWNTGPVILDAYIKTHKKSGENKENEESS